MANSGFSMAECRDALLELPHPFTRHEVQDVVQHLRTGADELRPYLNFSADHYTRTLFYRGARFEMLVLCWEDGQESPIHDHAASICSMAVVEGVCQNDNYRIAGGRAPCGVEPGEPVPLESLDPEVHAAGEVVTVVGGDIHRVGPQAGSGGRLVTVHFYLPPIVSMRCFDGQTGRCWVSEPEALLPQV